VIERREGDGRAWKCTLCYDRLHDGLEPACAKACPTDSIQFGVLERVHDMHAQMHGRGGKGEQLAVPRAEFRSYYGRPVLKKPAWDWKIATYLFCGGLSAGSAMLAAGADVTGRPVLRRVSRVGALVSIVASMYFLVADLGRPERFHHMLRVAKPSSPMSMGTWILSAYSAGAGLAGAAELMPSPLRRTWLGRLVGWLARPAGLWAAGTAPGVALLAGSALQRFGVFEAGVESTRDAKYVVVPQRERLDAGRPAG
jgi:polysulfide reductase-like protein/4Fe-4S dicluster protein